jgi:hypothetical protein
MFYIRGIGAWQGVRGRPRRPEMMRVRIIIKDVSIAASHRTFLQALE